MTATRPNPDMVYDGQRLTWGGIKYKATSGMPALQKPQKQCVSKRGPIPEGLYYLNVMGENGEAAEAVVQDWSQCELKPSWRIEDIPRGEEATHHGIDCERYWAVWGNYRVRIEPADETTNRKCINKGGKRDGFYIHDSTKGFSHGCIETEQRFFDRLIQRIGKDQRKLYLKVEYKEGIKTNGGTKK